MHSADTLPSRGMWRGTKTSRQLRNRQALTSVSACNGRAADCHSTYRCWIRQHANSYIRRIFRNVKKTYINKGFIVLWLLRHAADYNWNYHCWVRQITILALLDHLGSAVRFMKFPSPFVLFDFPLVTPNTLYLSIPSKLVLATPPIKYSSTFLSSGDFQSWINDQLR